MAHLEHGIGEEGLQRALLTVRLGLIVLKQLVKVSVLLAVGQDLQAVLVVAHKLLVDVQHRKQDVEQVGCGREGQRSQRQYSACCPELREAQEKMRHPILTVGQAELPPLLSGWRWAAAVTRIGHL